MSDLQPVQLQQDEQTGDRFLIYGSGSGIHVEVHYQGDQLWMTQAQIADLFGRDVSVISRHIGSILEEGELDESNLHKMQIASSAKPITLYSLDMVISVGYRTSSKQATQFRRWATEKLVQFATKGFVIDAARLKNPENRDRIAELRDIIRDIRSDEANVYRELRSICAMCLDYDGHSDVWHDFYRQTQAKLVYAVSSDTPAAILKKRADAAHPDMGLRFWPNDNIRKADVVVSKNYLASAEVRELNRLTTMAQAESLLNGQLRNLGRVVLRDGGRISMVDGKAHAEREYAKYKLEQKRVRHQDADRIIAEVKTVAKALSKGRSRPSDA